MAYIAPYVDAAGLHIPSYQDIFSYEQQQFLAIYGASVATGDDSSDMQWISVFSLMISDAVNAIQLAYNARSPLTAVGADLDSVVKINGITRLPASFSTANLTIGGVAGTLILNGIVQDQNGNLWALPTNVTIPAGGTVFVTGTCEDSGSIAAQPNTITNISTPTAGWNTVTNAAAAVEGAPVETDSQLRARQSISVALSSKTLLQGTISAIAAISGVTRYATGIPSASGTSTSVENPTGSTDSFGNPAHSITMVVEGGDSVAIATAIYQNKSIGCFTNGTTTEPVVDPNTGNTTNISFYRPSYSLIYTTLVVHGLVGFTSATVAAIQNAVFAYLNGLQIGELLTISGIYGAALAVMPNLLNPQFSIKAVYAGTSASSLGSFTIAGGGASYVVGDVLTVVQGGASGGTVKVTSVGGGGAVTGLAFVTPGAGYAVATGLATSGGTGSGATVNITGLGANTSTDITIAFNAVAEGLLGDVFVQVV